MGKPSNSATKPQVRVSGIAAGSRPSKGSAGGIGLGNARPRLGRAGAYPHIARERRKDPKLSARGSSAWRNFLL